MKKTEKWAISGMTCAACVARVEKSLHTLPGIEQANVNLVMGTAFVTYDEQSLTPQQITAKIDASGYHADWLGVVAEEASTPFKIKKQLSFTVSQATSQTQTKKSSLRAQYDQQQQRQQQELRSYQNIAIICLILSVPFMLAMISMVLPAIDWLHWFHQPWLQFLFATIIQFVGGWRFYRQAYFALKNVAANMDVLIVLGTTTAYLYSVWLLWSGDDHSLYFEASALVITFVLIGKWLELRARQATSVVLRDLLDTQPLKARLLKNEQEWEVEIETLQVGDLVLVKAGERVPIDGEILDGVATLDESSITGESMPVVKQTGMPVFSGTINQSGACTIRVTKTSTQTLLAQMIATVERAQTSKAPIQQLADKISAWFAWIVLSIAIFSAAIWWIWLAPNEMEQAMLVFTSVLVVACPCALGLATPASLIAGLGLAARHGILIKDGDALQRLSKVTHVAMDKTGTITEGRPFVHSLFVSDAARKQGFTEESLYSLIGSVEKFSEHPLAKAVMEKVKELNLSTYNPENYKAEPGQYVEAKVLHYHVKIVSDRWLKEHKNEYENAEALNMDDFMHRGNTCSAVLVDHTWVATLIFSDRLKENVGNVVKLLNEKFAFHLVTGDAAANKNLEILNLLRSQHHLHAGLLPSDKTNYIQQWQADGGVVLMVGDGINDAPAIASADVGMVVSNGTDLARYSASILLLNADLTLVVNALKIAQKTMRNIRQNLFWAFAFNTLTIPLAMAGLLQPWIAGAAMACSSIVVISNALRLSKLTNKL